MQIENIKLKVLDEAKKISQNGWRTVRFGDVVRNVDSSVRNPLEQGIERFVGLEHLDPESLHVKRWGNVADGTSFSRKFASGQVLFGKRRAYQRKAAVADFDGICSGDILVFEPKADELLPELLPFVVQSDGFFEHALGTSAGSLSPRTKWSDMARYEFVLPPKDEQRRIAEIFWANENALEKWRKTQNDTELARFSILSEIIDDSTDINKFALRDVCSRITDGTHQPPKFVSEGIPFFLVSNLASGKIDWNVEKWITPETYKELTKRVKPEFGDVLYTVVGSFGVPILVDWENPFSFQRHIAIMKPKKDVLLGEYLKYFLESGEGKRQANLMAAGNAQKTITLKSLSDFKIPLPNLEVQHLIVNRIRQFELALESISKNIKNLRLLKKALSKSLLNNYVQ